MENIDDDNEAREDAGTDEEDEEVTQILVNPASDGIIQNLPEEPNSLTKS